MLDNTHSEIYPTKVPNQCYLFEFLCEDPFTYGRVNFNSSPIQIMDQLTELEAEKDIIEIENGHSDK
jgi:hypothetical protein